MPDVLPTASTPKNPSARPAAESPKAKVAPAPRKAAAPAPTAASGLTSSAGSWKKFFSEWPSEIPQRGVVVNQLNEQLPFKAFMLKGDVVLLERTNPDTLGSRFILVPYSEIALVKLTDPIKQENFESAGFTGKLTM